MTNSTDKLHDRTLNDVTGGIGITPHMPQKPSAEADNDKANFEAWEKNIEPVRK